jgi:hypothetical protein
MIVFSKNRPMQLYATLESLLNRSNYLEVHKEYKINVLYKITPEYTESYKKIIEIFRDYFNFVQEKDFPNDVIKILEKNEYILFLVDDTIFIRDFKFENIFSIFENIVNLIGVSLRLSLDTTYCYSINQKQKIPDTCHCYNDFYIYDWSKAQFDFQYPIDLSSSFYKTDVLLPFIKEIKDTCINPNYLEHFLFMNIIQKAQYGQLNNLYNLAFPKKSIAISIPANIVNDFVKNRYMENGISPENLLTFFENGYRIDVDLLKDYPNQSVHEQINLENYFKRI